MRRSNSHWFHRWLARTVLVGCLPAWFVMAQECRAQVGFPIPRLQGVAPASVKAGDVVEFVITGLDLDGPASLTFSHGDIKAEPVTPPLPLDPKKAPKTAAAPGLRFKATIPAAMPLGACEVRVANKWGVSNPLAFLVSDLTEVAEKEPNNDVDQAQEVEVNSAIRGTISTAKDVDYYVFAGKKGQRVLIICLAASLGSPLDPYLQLFDTDGRELASNHNYARHEALLDVVLPRDGKYYVRLNQFAYSTGGPQFFYVLRISTGAWIDAMFPPVLEANKKTRVVVYGRNLPNGKKIPGGGRTSLEQLEIDVQAPSMERTQGSPPFGTSVPVPIDLEWLDYRLSSPFASNIYHLGLARGPVVIRNANNTSAETAQELTLPCEVAARMDDAPRRHWYAFAAKKGDAWDIDLLGDRLGSPTDLFLSIRDAATKKVIVDLDDTPGGKTLDPPRYRFVAPADGRFNLMVGAHMVDLENPCKNLYRLMIHREQADFRLLVSNQAGIGVVRKGGNDAIPIQVTRLGGWNGEISLTVQGLPPGVTCPPQVVGPGIKQCPLVFQITGDAPMWTGEVKIQGTAKIQGQAVTRLAAAGIFTPVPTPPTSRAGTRPNSGIMLAIRDSAPFRLGIGKTKTTLIQGEKFTVPLTVTKLWPDLKTPVQITSLNFPPALTITGKATPMTFEPTGANVVVNLEAKKELVPGTYTVFFQGQTQVPYSKDPGAKQKANVPFMVPSTPLTLTILPSQVATLSLTSPTLNVKIGNEIGVILKVKRLHDYPGEFKVRVVIPDTVAGLLADEVSIPAGKDEAKLVLKAAPTAQLGPRSGLLVRAVAQWQPDYQVLHEVKIAVNVVK